MLKQYFLLVVGLFLISSERGFSQSEFTPPNLIPPSPEASSLFKFNETPVSLNNGLANISIPIYTIKTKGLEIPINLSYHSRGIKVAELASRVGLGWTLNYGGAISRQIRDKSDDGDIYGYLSNTFYDDFFTNENTRNSIYLTEVYYGVDFDPDLFYFNFPGHNGKFIFDQVTRKPWQQKFSDIEISYSRDGINGIIKSFEILDAKGNKYFSKGKSKRSANRYRLPDKYSDIGTLYFDDKNVVLFDDINDSSSAVLKEQLENNNLPLTAKVNSPMSVLGHDILHAFNYLDNINNYRLRVGNTSTKSETPYFRNQEEKYTTTLSIQINRNLKENDRKNHNGLAVPTQGVKSNKIKK